jgi:hypothetical protein
MKYKIHEVSFPYQGKTRKLHIMVYPIKTIGKSGDKYLHPPVFHVNDDAIANILGFDTFAMATLKDGGQGTFFNPKNAGKPKARAEEKKVINLILNEISKFENAAFKGKRSPKTAQV